VKLDLQVRDLQSGDRSQKMFESADDAKVWLKDRPKFTEVLGVASHNVARDVSDALKACLRPLDEEEKLLVRQLDAAADDLLREAAKARRKKELAEVEKHRAELVNADPNRPLELRFVFNRGVANAIPGDPRDPTEEAIAAVMEWVEERNEWVRGRGQVVGDAKLQVWPGPIPEGKGDKRVISGSFIPVTAPAKDDAAKSDN
jgi:hypothetical protein